MSTQTASNWRSALGLQDWKLPQLFSSKDEIDSRAPQPHALRRAFDRLSLSGVLCLGGNAVAYFKEVKKIRAEQVTTLHRQFWNQGLAPILVLIDDTNVQVHSGLIRPDRAEERPTEPASLVQSLDRIADAAELRRLVLSIESGEYFRTHAKAFDPGQRVDRDLLRNLTATRNALTAASSRRLPSQVLDALLCRIVFVSYLFDRGVIGEGYLAHHGISKAKTLRDILQADGAKAKKGLYTLFERLGEDFNGDLFSEDLDAEAKHVTNDHLAVLDDFLSGTEVTRGQRRLFCPYDFSMIPIETISAIYEHFLKADDPDAKRKAGAFYTPRFLAEITLDIALEGIGSLHDKRFLDPSCGSGIFLVGVFNRIAEEWKRANVGARYDRRAEALIHILRTNIAGVDVNPTACRIAAFSLYLALLDQLSPPDIQELQRKKKFLPRLVAASEGNTDGNGTTIRCGDLFAVGATTANDYNCVIGNPPWASMTGPKSDAERWCERQGRPLPARQIATAFIWKAVEHLTPGGKVCFVLPHGVLFNHHPRAGEFQQAWLERHGLEAVLNLADMRRNLFEGAIGPALIVRYRKEPASTKTHRIRYMVPKTTWSASQAEVVSIAPEDRSEVSLNAVLSDLRRDHATTLWKQQFWGTSRDRRLLDRLTDLPRLSQVVGQGRTGRSARWVIAEGFQPLSPADDPAIARRIDFPTRLFVAARTIGAEAILGKSDCEPLPRSAERVRRLLNTNIFKAPHVLATKGLNVAFADFSVAFRHAVRGIHGPREDRDLLLFLAVYLRSSIARYFLFHTSGRWGVERSEVEVAELLKVPFPLPEDLATPKDALRIIRQVVKEVEAVSLSRGKLLSDREQVLSESQTRCDALMFEYFGLGESEQVLIDDTCRVVMESIQPSKATDAVPTLRIPSRDARSVYLQTLCSTLNDWASGGPYRVHGHVHASTGAGAGMIVLRRSTTMPAEAVEQPNDDSLLLETLARLRRSFAKELGSVDILRGIKVFDGDALYVFKPLEQRFWTRTAALNDADEIAATVLMRPRKERA